MPTDAVIMDYQNRVNTHLSGILAAHEVPATQLQDAMHYCLFPGGKRMRPLLVYLCGTLLDVPLNTLDPIACAIELVHAYSLVHDDLPAMDNDDFRRGKLSCHRAFDEATAILVGDGLQALATEVLLTQLPLTTSWQTTVQITLKLTKAAGISGMLSGQSLDLSALNVASTCVNEAELCAIHELKTGKLISACIDAVLLVSQASHEQTLALQQFARRLSLVFQMQDDYLDQYEQSTHLGKNRASDLSNQKLTFTAFMSQAELHERIKTEFSQTHAALSCFEHKAAALHALLHTLLLRSYPDAVAFLTTKS